MMPNILQHLCSTVWLKSQTVEMDKAVFCALCSTLFGYANGNDGQTKVIIIVVL